MNTKYSLLLADGLVTFFIFNRKSNLENKDLYNNELKNEKSIENNL